MIDTINPRQVPPVLEQVPAAHDGVRGVCGDQQFLWNQLYHRPCAVQQRCHH